MKESTDPEQMRILNPAKRRDDTSIAASYKNPWRSGTSQIRVLVAGKDDSFREVGQVRHCLLGAVEPQILRCEDVVGYNVPT